MTCETSVHTITNRGQRWADLMGQKVTLIMKSLQCDTSPSVQIQNNFSLLCNDSSSPADERNAVTRRFYRLCQFHFLLPVTVWGLHQHHTAAAMIDNTNTQTNILSSLITQCETTHNCETISLSSFLFHKTTERLWNNLRLRSDTPRHETHRDPKHQSCEM